MTVLNDIQIKNRAVLTKSIEERMIVPYVSYQVKQLSDGPVISFGQSSFGYDFRLAENVKLFSPVNHRVLDPKQFSIDVMVDAEVYDEGNGRYVIIPPYSFALGYAVERFNIPRDVITICLNKSTYARLGLILNVTPFEPGWVGTPTLEMTNPTPLPMKVYVNEGIGQLLFFQGRPCAVSYADRKGKYQDQPAQVVPARV